MKKFLIFLLIPLFSFSQEQLTEEMIIDHINEFFNALNIKNYNKELLSQKVTDDFIIYEMGDKFTLNEFTDFIESAGFLGWESTEWFLSDFTITIDNKTRKIGLKFESKLCLVRSSWATNKNSNGKQYLL